MTGRGDKCSIAGTPLRGNWWEQAHRRKDGSVAILETLDWDGHWLWQHVIGLESYGRNMRLSWGQS